MPVVFWNRASEMCPVTPTPRAAGGDRLDELLRLCRSIDHKLTRLTPRPPRSRYTYLSL